MVRKYTIELVMPTGIPTKAAETLIQQYALTLAEALQHLAKKHVPNAQVAVHSYEGHQ